MISSLLSIRGLGYRVEGDGRVAGIEYSESTCWGDIYARVWCRVARLKAAAHRLERAGACEGSHASKPLVAFVAAKPRAGVQAWPDFRESALLLCRVGGRGGTGLICE